MFGFHDPLHWDVHPANGEDFTVVSNGENSFTHKYSEGDKLYDINSYQVIREEKTIRVLKYTFSDDDFVSEDN